MKCKKVAILGDMAIFEILCNQMLFVFYLCFVLFFLEQKTKGGGGGGGGNVSSIASIDWFQKFSKKNCVHFLTLSV